MLRIVDRASLDSAAQDRLTLSFEERCRSRQRVRLDSGREAGLFLPPGTVLRGGDRVRTDDGLIIEVCAAGEEVSTARTGDPCALARACYHLGNRHIAAEIGIGWVRYLRDHVLDAMVAGLGLAVASERLPFEPEAGAYGGHHHHDD